jgi:hypothetical protein
MGASPMFFLAEHGRSARATNRSTISPNTVCQKFDSVTGGVNFRFPRWFSYSGFGFRHSDFPYIGFVILVSPQRRSLLYYLPFRV